MLRHSCARRDRQGFVIEDYTTPGGNSPVREFLSALDDDALARTHALLGILAERGAAIRAPHSKAFGDGLHELRDVGTGVRVFYVFAAGHRIVLLDGIVKKRLEIPARVLARVRSMQADYRRAHKAPTGRRG
jgi:phage-related protein